MIIRDFPNYSIFKDGTVINNVSGKPLKPFDLGTGYKGVGLYKNKRVFKFYVHRLVAIHFINNPQNFHTLITKTKTNPIIQQIT